jgi:hypothetical protein
VAQIILDLLSKHPVPENRSDQIGLFIDKLRENKQTPVQQKQAAHAVSLLALEKGIIDLFSASTQHFSFPYQGLAAARPQPTN